MFKIYESLRAFGYHTNLGGFYGIFIKKSGLMKF